MESPHASYIIDGNDCIEAFCSRSIDISNTLFNLPAAGIAQLHGDLLLHSSSVEINKRIFAFCAEKGTGKSTLITSLCSFLNFFSDDTLYLHAENEQRIKCYTRIAKQIKLTPEAITAKGLSEKELFQSYELPNGKLAIDARSIGLRVSSFCVKDPPILDSIFIIRRWKQENFKIKPIFLQMEKMAHLFEQCIGTSFFPKEWKISLMQSDIFSSVASNVRFFTLFIPNNLSAYDTQVSVLTDQLLQLAEGL